MEGQDDKQFAINMQANGHFSMLFDVTRETDDTRERQRPALNTS